MSKVKQFFHELVDKWRRNGDIYFDFVIRTIFQFVNYFILSFLMLFFVVVFYQARREQGLTQPILPYQFFNLSVIATFVATLYVMGFVVALWFFYLPNRFNRFVARREAERSGNLPIKGFSHLDRQKKISFFKE